MIRVVFFRGRKLGRQSYRFRIVGANGEKIAQSEAYSNSQDCIDTAHLVTGVRERDVREEFHPSWRRGR